MKWINKNLDMIFIIALFASFLYYAIDMLINPIEDYPVKLYNPFCCCND